MARLYYFKSGDELVKILVTDTKSMKVNTRVTNFRWVGLQDILPSDKFMILFNHLQTIKMGREMDKYIEFEFGKMGYVLLRKMKGEQEVVKGE